MVGDAAVTQAIAMTRLDAIDETTGRRPMRAGETTGDEMPVTREIPSTSGDATFALADTRAGAALKAPRLDRVARHVFTTRALVLRGDREQADLARVAEALDIQAERLARVRQIHGRRVLVVSAGAPWVSTAVATEADAVVSADPATAVMVRVADCVPILLADEHHRVVAAIHAGWRGSCAGIVGATIEAIDALGVAPGTLHAAIGPSIGACCYQVDDRVRTAFLAMTPDAAAWFTEDGPGHWRLDLWLASLDQLTSAGVPADRIEIARMCTAERLDVCYSYRAEGPATGRMAAAIGLRS